MKKFIIALSLIPLLTACAHERTEMDRELALKLVDKAGRIEIVQTINGAGAQPLLGAANATQAQYQQDTHQTCTQTPIYDSWGRYVRTTNNCF